MNTNPAPPTRRRYVPRPLFWTALTALLAVAATLAAWHFLPGWSTAAPLAAPDAAEPLPVNVAPVEFVDSIEQTRTYTGLVRARMQSELAFESVGKIESVSVEDGDSVLPGALIATLDTRTLEAQRQAVMAQRAQAEAVLAELQAGPRAEQIAAAEADLAAARATAQNAESRRQRREKLVQQGALPPEEYDQAESEARAAEARMEAAQQRLAELEAGTRTEKITAQLATLKQLAAAEQELEVALAKSRLVAPFGGTVTRRLLDPGSIAGPQSPVVKLVQTDQLEAWIGLPVDLAASILPDSTHPLRIGQQVVTGIAKATIQELDPATRTQRVVWSLPSHAAPAVVPGQLCEIELTSTVNTPGYWIPNSALARGIRGLWSVMVAQPDGAGQWIVRKHDIEIVKTSAGRVLARGTLQPGDRIIVDGLHRITEGQHVRPLETGAVTASPAPRDQAPIR